MSDEKRVELDADKLEKVAGGASYAHYYWIDSSNCYSCGACYEVCPCDAVYDAGSYYAIDSFGCWSCGVCAEVCPSGAIHPV